MSTKGIYTALSGAMAQNQKLETIANNLANVNTPGFKKDQQVFREYLSAYEKAPSSLETPRIPSSIESFYDLQAADRSYVDSAGTFTDFSQGAMRLTGNKLDFSINGKAFFEVLTPGGVRWTRNGSFKMDAEGRLVNHSGHPVLKAGSPGENPEQRTIQLTSPNVQVTADGTIYQDGNSLGKLALTEILPAEGIQKEGHALYRIRDNFNAEMNQSALATVNQGALETSNVNIIQEMTDMIAASRTFEGAQRAIKAYDSMADKMVNVLPRVD